MIDFFYYPSPNARKVLIALEELELRYTVRWVDITKGDQHQPEFRAINPNGKVPAIVDHDGPSGRALSLFESGAILEYLADKTGRLLPRDAALAWEARAWVYWQAANQGPMAGQATHFLRYAADRGVDDTYARDRYLREAARTYEVLNTRLGDRDYLVGEYSIADIMCFPWTRVADGHGVSLDDYPAVKTWSERIKTRPAAKVRIEDRRDETARQSAFTDEQWQQLFGAPAPGRRSGPAS